MMVKGKVLLLDVSLLENDGLVVSEQRCLVENLQFVISRDLCPGCIDQ